MAQTRTWQEILGRLVSKQDLDRESASWAMTQIMAGESSEAEIAAFMLALRSKGESVDELAGLVDVMLTHSVVLDSGDDAVDIVGTGGDMVGTVNISTMAAILVAAAGVPVLKHGSRSASGKTGSSEMLEVLGIRLDLTPTRVAEVFREVGISFFYAPVFHPAMRHVAPIRKQLGIPTTFNFLGPLANPAQPLATALGVANESIAPLMAQELAQRGRYGLVFRGKDGLDELSTSTLSDVWIVSNGEVHQDKVDPKRLGLELAPQEALLGGGPKENAKVALELFGGEQAEKLHFIRESVILNAAGGVVAYELAKNQTIADLEMSFSGAISLVTQALDDGSALAKLNNWIAATQF